MRNILYIHQYFKTPEEGGALRSYFIAKGMIGHGYRVQMITAHNQPKYELKIVEGISVHYLPVKYSNSMPYGARYFAFIKFVYLAIRLISKLPHFDLVYASSTPLTVGLVALWVKRKYKVPYIFEVRDLWPEAPIQLGVMKNALLKRLSKSLEKNSYKNASKTIALSPGIQSGIVQVWPLSKVTMVPNMSDIEFFSKCDHQTNEPFTIGYFGTFGLANNMDFILQFANECQEQALKVKFLLIGDGAQSKFLADNIQKRLLKNVELIKHRNRFQARDLMSKVEACLITFLDFSILETNSPNKFFDALAAGKLCILNTKGWLKDLAENNKCGIYINTSKIESFPDQLKPFINNKGLLKEYQKNARSLAQKEFSRKELVAKICNEVAEVIPNI